MQLGNKENLQILYPLTSSGLVQIILKAATGETTTLSGTQSETVFAIGIIKKPD
jgi:hypothetical protein